MGNVERVDKTLKLNEMIYYVRKDAVLRDRWQNDLKALCDQFELSDKEYAALESRDPARLMDIGVHQYLVPHIMRLFYGTSGMTNSHPALRAYIKAFPEESRQALSGTTWQHLLSDDG
jgi:hypothetical protein